MHAVSSNQIADILHFNDKYIYIYIYIYIYNSVFIYDKDTITKGN